MKKWILSIVGTLLGVFLILVALVPTLLSTDAGKRFIIGKIEKATHAKIAIEDLDLSWFGIQQVDAFTLDDGKGLKVTFNQLTSTCSFWNLLFRSGDTGETKLKSPTITIQAKGPSVKPETQKRVAKEKEKLGKVWSNYSGKLIVEKGKIETLDNGRTLVSVQEVHLEFDTPKHSSSYTVIAQGKTEQNALSGDFNIHVKTNSWIEGEAQINNFPVWGLDQVLGTLNPKHAGMLLAALGDTLNLSLRVLPDQAGQSMVLTVRSPRLLVNLSTSYQNALLTLVNEGRIAWTIKPLIGNVFMEKVPLKSDAQAEIWLTAASIPLKDHKLAWRELAATGNIRFTGGRVFLEEIQQDILVSDLSSDFHTNKLEALLDVTFNGALSHTSPSEAQFKGTATIQNPLDKMRAYPKFDLNFNNLPLALIDLWKKSDSVKYLGAFASGRLMRSDDELALSLQTPLLKIPESLFILSDVARLVQPTSLTYVVSQTLYPELARPVTLTGTLNTLMIPLKGLHLDFAKATFDLQTQGQNIQLQNLFALGGIILPFVDLDVRATSLDHVQFNGTSRLDFLPNTWGLSLLGSEIGVKTSGSLKWKEEIAVSPLLILLDGRKFKSTLEGAIEKSTLILSKPLEIHFLLEPEQINPFLAKESAYPLLAKPTPFQIAVRPSQLPLKKTAFSALSVKGAGRIEELALYAPSSGYPFDFHDVTIDFDLDGKKESQEVLLSAKGAEKGIHAGSVGLELRSSGSASHLLKDPTSVKATLKDFSSQIADAFLGMRGQLPDMIGPSLTLNYQMARQTKGQNIDLKVDSRDLKLEGAFAVGNQLELRSPRSPLKMEWKLTEKSYDAFQRWRRPNVPEVPNNPLFEIQGTSQLKIQVSSLGIPVQENGKAFPKVDFNLYKSLFDAQVRIEDLILKQGITGIATKLNQFDFGIKKGGMGNTPLSFKFEGNIRPEGQGQTGSVRGEGNLENFLSQTGTFDLSAVTTEIHATIKNLPSVFVDALTRFDQRGGYPPSAFLGDLFNATFDADIQKSQGALTMDIDATGCRASFAGIVSDGVIYLKEPFKAAFTITPQLNRILERSANLVVVAMEKPITLFLNPKGFSVPLKNLHMRNMNFNYGQLDLGQIVCKNTGSASAVSSLFKNQGDKNTSFWFAPMECNMRQGNMFVDRTEILYNHALQVCLWGNVNFARRYVDMILGLTAQAMGAALGITSVGPDYVLKVPVEGPFGNVQIDTGAATGKIAFLVARKQIAPKAGVWGQVLGAIGDLADDQSDVPPPKPPFPWQKKN
ncbi:MAG: hypothetical protein AB7S94_09825 [Simkaniaceae bacterium]